VIGCFDDFSDHWRDIKNLEGMVAFMPASTLLLPLDQNDRDRFDRVLLLRFIMFSIFTRIRLYGFLYFAITNASFSPFSVLT